MAHKKNKYFLPIYLLSSTLLIGALVATSIYTNSLKDSIPPENPKGRDTDMNVNKSNTLKNKTMTNEKDFKSNSKEHTTSHVDKDAIKK